MSDDTAKTPDSDLWQRLSPSERRLIALTAPGFIVADLCRKRGQELTVEQDAFAVMMVAHVLDGLLPPGLFEEKPAGEGTEPDA